MEAIFADCGHFAPSLHSVLTMGFFPRGKDFGFFTDPSIISLSYDGSGHKISWIYFHHFGSSFVGLCKAITLC